MQIKYTSANKIFTALFFLICLPAFSQNFEYVGTSNPPNFVVISVAPPSFILGDRAVDAYICKDFDGYVCINSEWFNFAIPVGMNRQNKTWEQGGKNYQLIEYKDSRSSKLSKIQSTQDGIKYQYFYSNKRGLYEFSAELDGGLAKFVSLSGKGFGFRD